MLKYLLENLILNQLKEYNDNRSSLYVGQNRRCGITGKDKYIRMEVLDKKALNNLNLLRKKVGNHII